MIHDLHNLNKESSISINYNKENNTYQNISHLDNKEARLEYLEAFNYELSLQLKQTILDKNKLEEKVYEYELTQFRQNQNKLDTLQLEKLISKVENIELKHDNEMKEIENNYKQMIMKKEKE